MRRPLTLGTRVFRSKTFYAWAMVSNLVGRFAWAVTITPHGKGGVFFILNGAGLTGEAAGTFVAVLELLRRAQWTFLRLENEYLNNSARYRSVVAAPMLLDDVGSSNWDSEWKFEREVRAKGGGGEKVLRGTSRVHSYHTSHASHAFSTNSIHTKKVLF